jgi:small acid-soluble spore protein (thioredoxin-like protein)
MNNMVKLVENYVLDWFKFNLKGVMAMAKPDDRSDNVAHLQEHVQNTIDNLQESEDYLDEHADEISSEELNNLTDKNQNRRQSISSFREEIKDETEKGNG